jgi:hypothetical protein
MRTTITITALIVLFAGQGTAQPVKCGWGVHPPDTQDKIAAIPLARPIRDLTYTTPGSTFAVHYDTAGSHTPDLTSSRPDGTPDWVVEVGTALDSVRSFLIRLGFDQALPDGDGIFDVYLTNYGGGLYGETFYPDQAPGGGWIAYIEMENDFALTERYLTHGLAAARVTCAHEYFHAVQLAQEFKSAGLFLYELTSTWFEEVAYPEVNDWIGWFDESGGFAHNPATDMVRTDGYSIAAFGHYLTGWALDTLNIMTTIWDLFRLTDARDAINQAVGLQDGDLTTIWTDFVGRLFMNGQAPQYYFHPDQALLAEPDEGSVYQLLAEHRVSFDNLIPGKAGIQTLEVPANQGFSLEVDFAPSTYAARIAILGENPFFSPLGRDSWLGVGDELPTRIVLIAGADGDSVAITALPGPVQFALNNLYPNPISLSEHGDMTLEYVVPANLPAGQHRLMVYDLLGREIYRQTFAEPEYGQIQTVRIPTYAMQTWASGIYILRLSLGSAAAIRRFTFLK